MLVARNVTMIDAMPACQHLPAMAGPTRACRNLRRQEYYMFWKRSGRKDKDNFREAGTREQGPRCQLQSRAGSPPIPTGAPREGVEPSRTESMNQPGGQTPALVGRTTGLSMEKANTGVCSSPSIGIQLVERKVCRRRDRDVTNLGTGRRLTLA